ncbi:MAG: LacI family DNA-binding transcriptional regulator [Selenomonas sp.]|uniref:LacI family DNA-binding transcriptional regulator n=1 Tax=Selenomonas sp. TaxID=2053611 RepID=UPI0025CEC8A0|nr:LacI family DNA-binding transcriptional regulator [Selenomonas sp.]MCR5758636.1 LacI family DNA-binding transcriptional regulator [Selenomonas sp.]
MKVNIRKISELSGFSPATVSNALNNKKGVNHETAMQILAIAKECGYISETKIQSIKLVYYHDSGEIVSDSPFFNNLLESVSNACREEGMDMKVVNLYRRDGNYAQQVELLLQDTSAAILLVGTELSEEDAKAFLDTKMPLVLLDCSFAALPFHSVLMDNENSMGQAAEYLIGLGHRKIGYLRSKVPSHNFQERYRGYEQIMRQHGLAVEKKYGYEVPVSITGAYEMFCRLLEEDRELPTAFLADNDMIALGVMQALQKHQIRIPEDISVVGFDDIEFSRVCAPGLTTVRVHMKELGELAVNKLLEVIKRPQSIPARTQMYTKLVLRGSTAAPADETKI